jgi:protein-L-isoaspartate(D-aspartate) O-methyltransferase
MEKLQSLLISYYQSHQEDLIVAPWSEQYANDDFPKYWAIVFDILSSLNKDYKVLEIGCGLGDVTVIPCYLGFKRVLSFEKNPVIAEKAKDRIKDMFNMTDIVMCQNYPTSKDYVADILILVNCAYGDLASTKEEYMKLMQEYYIHAGNPRYFIMEVIDNSYTQYDLEFPDYIRLSSEEVHSLFPNSKIQSWRTYVYPKNRRSKTLYLIEKQ